MANVEESKVLNQDKIILYHGETYGTWIYQMILKEFLYPDAPDDWLPLRHETLRSDIDKTALLRLIKDSSDDHHEEYTKIGLSVTANLVSESWAESAWGSICKRHLPNWHKISGFSDYYDSMHHELYAILKEKFIPREQWGRFKVQKKLLNYFIQEKRGQFRSNWIKDFRSKFENYFPNTFRLYKEEFKSFFQQDEKKKAINYKTEGVLLQIILDKEMADQITYYSYPLGWLKDDGKYLKSHYEEKSKVWEGDEIKLYSGFYEQVKNRKDNEQARIALTNDFRLYPSRVRIKAIAGIMENPVDYEIVKSMIREMVADRNDSTE